MTMMKCLVIGFGSIGQRHARVLNEMGHEVAVLSGAPVQTYPCHSALNPALHSFEPDYVVVANDTGKHAETLDQLAELSYQGITLVEKPLAATNSQLKRTPTGPVHVGYILRFHPALKQLKAYLGASTLWSLTAYCGQYLPDWRPGRDYRQSYSARPDEGGVIRDLSHELDYVQWLAGSWQRTVSAGGRVSNLEISSEDCVSILANCEDCPLVTVHINYLDRLVSRRIVVNGPFGTATADLIASTLSINGEEMSFQFDRDALIREQHVAAMSHTNVHKVCTLDEAQTTMQWIDAIHRSLIEQRWIARPSISVKAHGLTS